MAARTAIVTGAAGFIGSHVTDALLADGYRVLGVDDLSTGREHNLQTAATSAAFDLETCDVGDPHLTQLFERFRPDVCLHLAAQSGVRPSLLDPVADASINILGTLGVVRACIASGTQTLVYAASGGTLYGQPDPATLPVTEDAAVQPDSPYGVSKMVPLHYLRVLRSLGGPRWVALALANVYGPRQDPHGEAGVVAIFADDLLAGRRPAIFGTGRQTRDFVYVGDVAQAFLAAIGVPGEIGTVNIGSGEEVSVLEILERLQRITDVSVEPTYEAARTGELDRISLDPSLAARHLDWRPQVALDDGLRAVVDALTDRQLEQPRAS